jgi:hypothetical protein
VYGKKDKGSKLPHLVHTPESGELTLTLDQLSTKFSSSRFAVELLTLSSFPFNKSEKLVAEQFSDDKSSSGTFVVSNFTFYHKVYSALSPCYTDSLHYTGIN